MQSFDVTLWRSLNGGQDFTNIAPAKGGDKQWFVIDNTATSTGHGFQYQFWDNASPFAPGEFSRSTDGGFTWMDPITIPNAPQWGTPDVDSNGILYFGGVTHFEDPVLVHSLNQCKERCRHADLRSQHPGQHGRRRGLL